MITSETRRKYLSQLRYFQSQIPLGKETNLIPTSTVEHYSFIVGNLQNDSSEDFSNYLIPQNVKFNEERYYTDGVRDRLGSLIGYLEGLVDEPKRAGSNDLLMVITGIRNSLRKLFRIPPKNEKEVQEKMEDLFNGMQLKFRREQEHIPYSSRTYIPDFTIDDLDCIVEIKICDTVKREKELVQEINDDIQAYSTRYKNLIFVVYDVAGFLRDIERFKHDIEAESVLIEVIKH